MYVCKMCMCCTYAPSLPLWMFYMYVACWKLKRVWLYESISECAMACSIGSNEKEVNKKALQVAVYEPDALVMYVSSTLNTPASTKCEHKVGTSDRKWMTANTWPIINVSTHTSSDSNPYGARKHFTYSYIHNPFSYIHTYISHTYVLRLQSEIVILIRHTYIYIPYIHTYIHTHRYDGRSNQLRLFGNYRLHLRKSFRQC